MLIIHAWTIGKKFFLIFFEENGGTAIDSSKLVSSERPIDVHDYNKTVWTKNQEFLFSTWHLLKKYVEVFRNMLFENNEHLKKKYHFWLKNFEQKC